VLTDKEFELDQHLPTTDVLITTHFGRLTLLKIGFRRLLILTAAIGSDHIDLAAAAARRIIVAGITGSNVVSVAEQVVMHIFGSS
jgi:formate dehydrogenase